MAAEPAALVQKVVGTKTTDDKQHMLLKLAMPAGDDLILAVPQAEIGNMLEAAALGLNRGEGTGPGIGKAPCWSSMSSFAAQWISGPEITCLHRSERGQGLPFPHLMS
jgi:hypothetical protein